MQGKKKENKGSQKKGSLKKREKGFPLAKLDTRSVLDFKSFAGRGQMLDGQVLSGSGTRGSTGSEGCLLLYSGVGKSLIFPIPLFLLSKFDAGKPGESVSALLHSRTLTEFSAQSGRRVRECVSVYRRAPRVFRINQRAGMQLKYFGSTAWLGSYMDRLLEDVAGNPCIPSISLFRGLRKDLHL